MILKILTYPNPTLLETCLPIQVFGGEDLISMKQNMLETMIEANGVGLAGIQVGFVRRVLTLNRVDGSPSQIPLFLCNPTLTSKSEEVYPLKEGCLSVPGVTENVNRSRSCHVHWFNEWGEEREGDFNDLASICVQHEIDHLNGCLFFQKLSALKQSLLLKKHSKKQRIHR